MKIVRALAAEPSQSASMLDHLSTLADPLRCRMLLVLERHELTVSELCVVLQLPQSTVSRHLKMLADTAWVSSRRDEPVLRHVDRRARRRRPPPLADPSRAGRGHERRGSRRTSSEERARTP